MQCHINFILSHQFKKPMWPFRHFFTSPYLKFVTYSISYSSIFLSSEDQQLNRLMQRNDLDEQAAQARINSQMSLKEKCQLCTYVIDNTQTIDVTRSHVDRVYKTLKASKKHLFFRFGLLFVFIPLSLAAFFLCKLVGLF